MNLDLPAIRDWNMRNAKARDQYRRIPISSHDIGYSGPTDVHTCHCGRRTTSDDGTCLVCRVGGGGE